MLSQGRPCQDAAGARVVGARVLLAVADGHGSAEYTHSDEGARTAVRVALDALDDLLDRLAAAPNRHDPAALALEHGPALARRVAWEWNRRVRHHVAMRVALDGGEIPGPIGGEWVEEIREYGTTLLAAAFEPDLSVWLRLGDGEALAVRDGAARFVFPRSDKSFGQATHSLGSRGWTERVELAFEGAPAGIAVLGTDGLADPYGVEPAFEEEWGTRLAERIARNGWVETVLELPRWLGAVGRDGDDCSVAVAMFPEE